MTNESTRREDGIFITYTTIRKLVTIVGLCGLLLLLLFVNKRSTGGSGTVTFSDTTPEAPPKPTQPAGAPSSPSEETNKGAPARLEEDEETKPAPATVPKRPTKTPPPAIKEEEPELTPEPPAPTPIPPAPPVAKLPGGVFDYKLEGTCDCEQPKEQGDGHYKAPNQYVFNDPDIKFDELIGFVNQSMAEGKQLRVAFLGDSLARHLFAGLVDRVEQLGLMPSVPKMDYQMVHGQGVHIHYPEENYEDAPIRVFYKNQYYPSMHTHFKTSGLAAYNPTHLIVTRGAWDIKVMHPRSPSVPLRNFPPLFVHMRRHLGKDTRIFYASLPYHFSTAEGCKRVWGNDDCAVSKDQESFRAGLYCAVKRANMEGANVEHFNMYQMTKRAGVRGTGHGDGVHPGWDVLRFLTSSLVHLFTRPPTIIEPMKNTCPLARIPLGEPLPPKLKKQWDGTQHCSLKDPMAPFLEKVAAEHIDPAWPTTPGIGVPYEDGTLDPLHPQIVERCSFFHATGLMHLNDFSFSFLSPEQCARDRVTTAEEVKVVTFGGSFNATTFDCPPPEHFSAKLFAPMKFCLEMLNRIDTKTAETVLLPWARKKQLTCPVMLSMTFFKIYGETLYMPMFGTLPKCLAANSNMNAFANGKGRVRGQRQDVAPKP